MNSNTVWFATLFFALRISAFAQLESPEDNAKPLRECVEVFPYLGEENELSRIKYKIEDAEVPSELSVEVKEQEIHIFGTKICDTSEVHGTLAGHFGKLALMPVKEASGTCGVKFPYLYNSTYYFLVFERTGGHLQEALVRLVPNVKYEWSTTVSGSDFILKVTSEGLPVQSLVMKKEDVAKFGFAATVRSPGTETDFTITVH